MIIFGCLLGIVKFIRQALDPKPVAPDKGFAARFGLKKLKLQDPVISTLRGPEAEILGDPLGLGGFGFRV